LTRCKVIAHNGEKEWIENVDKQFADRPVPGFHSLVGGSVIVERTVNEGDKIDLGDNLQLRVIHTPGHSKGSISLYLEPDQVLFVGDAVPITGDMPIYDDPLVSIESIKKLKIVNKVNVLLSSWDEPRTGSSIGTVLQDGVQYIQRLHNTVIEVVKADPQPVAPVAAYGVGHGVGHGVGVAVIAVAILILIALGLIF